MDGITAHRTVLRDRHEALNRSIEIETNRSQRDDLLIGALKRQKLVLKEEIALYE